MRNRIPTTSFPASTSKGHFTPGWNHSYFNLCALTSLKDLDLPPLPWLLQVEKSWGTLTVPSKGPSKDPFTCKDPQARSRWQHSVSQQEFASEREKTEVLKSTWKDRIQNFFWSEDNATLTYLINIPRKKLLQWKSNPEDSFKPAQL